MYQFISKRKRGEKTAGVNKNRCSEVPLEELQHQPSFKIPIQSGWLTACEAHFVKAAKEKAFPHI